jgi:hypothetical protein
MSTATELQPRVARTINIHLGGLLELGAVACGAWRRGRQKVLGLEVLVGVEQLALGWKAIAALQYQCTALASAFEMLVERGLQFNIRHGQLAGSKPPTSQEGHSEEPGVH